MQRRPRSRHTSLDVVGRGYPRRQHIVVPAGKPARPRGSFPDAEPARGQGRAKHHRTRHGAKKARALAEAPPRGKVNRFRRRVPAEATSTEPDIRRRKFRECLPSRCWLSSCRHPRGWVVLAVTDLASGRERWEESEIVIQKGGTEQTFHQPFINSRFYSSCIRLKTGQDRHKNQ
jgi:hypothetical protein